LLSNPIDHVVIEKVASRSAVGPTPDAGRRRAGELYPDAAEHLTRKRDAGRADAILIARAGLMMLRQPADAA
jgi:hypothetical protein